MATEQSIPVVNLQDFLSADPAKRENFVKVLGDALTDLGFFAVTHHGVDSALIKRCYGLCEAFFTQDNETKCKSERPELKGQRGFTSFGRESAKDAKTADLKNIFMLVASLIRPTQTYPSTVRISGQSHQMCRKPFDHRSWTSTPNSSNVPSIF